MEQWIVYVNDGLPTVIMVVAMLLVHPTDALRPSPNSTFFYTAVRAQSLRNFQPPLRKPRSLPQHVPSACWINCSQLEALI